MSSELKKGSEVVVWRDNGEALLTRTRSEVRPSANGDVVWVEGVSGYYDTKCVRPVTVHPCTRPSASHSDGGKGLRELRSKITTALCDPKAPWYGSDVVGWVDDYMRATAATPTDDRPEVATEKGGLDG